MRALRSGALQPSDLTRSPDSGCSTSHHSCVVPSATVLSVTARGVIPPSERARLRAAADEVGVAAAELKAAVCAAWEAGGSVREIADELGKSTRTIQDWIREGDRR